MTTPEGKVKKALDKMLKAEGIWFYSPQAGPYGVSGIPDRVAVVCGLFVGIEAKANSKCEMTALQERCMKQIKAAGGYHFLVYDKETIDQVRQFITDVRSRGPRQKGSSRSFAQPRGNSSGNPKREASTREPSTCSASTRGNTSTAEPWAHSTGANPILL